MINITLTADRECLRPSGPGLHISRGGDHPLGVRGHQHSWVCWGEAHHLMHVTLSPAQHCRCQVYWASLWPRAATTPWWTRCRLCTSAAGSGVRRDMTSGGTIWRSVFIILLSWLLPVTRTCIPTPAAPWSTQVVVSRQWLLSHLILPTPSQTCSSQRDASPC